MLQGTPPVSQNYDADRERLKAAQLEALDSNVTLTVEDTSSPRLQPVLPDGRPGTSWHWHQLPPVRDRSRKIPGGSAESAPFRVDIRLIASRDAPQCTLMRVYSETDLVCKFGGGRAPRIRAVTSWVQNESLDAESAVGCKRGRIT